MGGDLIETDIAQMAADFRDGNNIMPEASPREQIPMAPQGDSLVPEEDNLPQINWADDDRDQAIQEETVVSQPNLSEAPPQTIKFKANGEDKELSLEEAQKQLSLAEGARQALNDRAKLKKESDELKKQLEEAKQYKEKWDALEAVKHDRKKVLETLTGQSYDDFITQEIQRREIHQYGTEEQKQLLDYSERVAKLERERQLETSKREEQLKKTQEARDAAEELQFNNTLEREYHKQLESMPKELDPARATRFKNILWNSAKIELKQYAEKYGKITHKMVEKAFKDNAEALFQGTTELVDKKLSQALDSQKKTAKEQAQLASVKQTRPVSNVDISRMSSNQLIDYYNSKKR